MFRKWETLSREELQKLISESTSYSEVLTKLNLKPKGVNHVEIKNYLKNNDFNIDTLVGRSIYRGNGTYRSLIQISEATRPL